MKWTHIKIPKNKTNIFCNVFISEKKALNIIVSHTPICTTLDIFHAYEPLANYPVNVFAFDFSGTGKSGGEEKDFSLDSIQSDFEAIIHYIQENYSSNIHLFGNTGIGGMFAQHYVSSTKKIKSFAQFACVDYKNTAGIGYPYWLAKIINWLLKTLPNFHFTVKPPKYKGYNYIKDNEIYKMLEARNPDIFKNSSKIMNCILECFLSQNSTIKNGVFVPTLVFKTLHDRFFSTAYFDKYYVSLQCEKKLIEIDDVHNSYYFRSKDFCNAAYKWFLEHQ